MLIAAVGDPCAAGNWVGLASLLAPLAWAGREAFSYLLK